MDFEDENRTETLWGLGNWPSSWILSWNLLWCRESSTKLMRTCDWTTVQLFYRWSCGGLLRLRQDRTGSISVQELQKALMYHIVGYVVVTQQQIQGSGRKRLTAHHDESNLLSQVVEVQTFFSRGKCRSSNRVFSPKKLTISPCVETGCLSAYPFLQELTAESLWNISKGMAWRPALTSLFAYLIYCLHSYLSHMWSEKKSRDLGTFPSSGIDSWWPWKIQTCHLGGWDCQFLGAKSWWYCGGKSFATSACQSNELFKS